MAKRVENAVAEDEFDSEELLAEFDGLMAEFEEDESDAVHRLAVVLEEIVEDADKAGVDVVEELCASVSEMQTALEAVADLLGCEEEDEDESPDDKDD